MINPSKHLVTSINIAGLGTFTNVDNISSIDTVKEEYELSGNRMNSTMGSVDLRSQTLQIPQGDSRLIEVQLDWSTIFKDICYAYISWNDSDMTNQVQFTSVGLPDIDIGIDPEDLV